MTFRGVVELIRDGAWAQDGWTQGRKPRIRDDLVVIGHATNAWWAEQRQEAIGLSNEDASLAAAGRHRTVDLVNDGTGGISLASGDTGQQSIAEEWIGNIRRMAAEKAQRQGPQGNGSACGPVTEQGYCRNSSHTPACAASMSGAVTRATFTPAGSPESDTAWRAAAAEREHMLGLSRAPGAETEADRRAAKHRELAAEREQRLARSRTGAAWVVDGRHPEWLSA